MVNARMGLHKNMALREVDGMGRHSCEHPGWLLCRYRSLWTWRGLRTRCCQEMPEIRQIPLSIHFPSNGHGDLGLNEQICIPFLRRSWPQALFIYQRLSVTIQRSNAALFHKSFTRHDDPDLQPFHICFYSFSLFLTPGPIVPGYKINNNNNN